MGQKKATAYRRVASALLPNRAGYDLVWWFQYSTNLSTIFSVVDLQKLDTMTSLKETPSVPSVLQRISVSESRGISQNGSLRRSDPANQVYSHGRLLFFLIRP
jgi:hypothetical protein